MSMGYSSGSRRATMVRIAGLCGVLAPVIAFAFILLAISHFPHFTWTENWLSDLGVQGTAATLFNSGLIAGGILGIGFGIGLGEIFRAGQRATWGHYSLSWTHVFYAR